MRSWVLYSLALWSTIASGTPAVSKSPSSLWRRQMESSGRGGSQLPATTGDAGGWGGRGRKGPPTNYPADFQSRRLPSRQLLPFDPTYPYLDSAQKPPELWKAQMESVNRCIDEMWAHWVCLISRLSRDGASSAKEPFFRPPLKPKLRSSLYKIVSV